MPSKGSGQWMERAADALLRWLDEGEVSRERTLEALFVIAYQADLAGRADFARTLVAEIAERVTADAQPTSDAATGDGAALQNLAMISLHLGIAVPPELAGAILKQGRLSAAQEVQLLQALETRIQDAQTAQAELGLAGE